MKKFWVNFLCCFIPFRRVRHKLKRQKTCPARIIVIDEKGYERSATPKELLSFNIRGAGVNNVIRIEAPVRKDLVLNISYNGSDNNCIIIHKNVWGIWSFGCSGKDNKAEIGSGSNSYGVGATLIGNELYIGRDNLFSNDIRIWGNGHSVLDLETGRVLNKHKEPIVIGDHCWIGERVTLTKKAQIPNDCIVGIASVVTKKFTEEHCVLAGSPAKIVKTGVTWHRDSPLIYEKKNKSGE